MLTADTIASRGSPRQRTQTDNGLHHFELTAEHNAMMAPVLTDLAKAYGCIENPDLTKRAAVLSRDVLPEPLVEFLDDFRIREPSALCMLSGLPVYEDQLGETPAHWRNSQYRSRAFALEIFFLLCSSVLGDVFAWATQQDGRIMHDVLPIEGHEHYEIGSNSLQHLSWHTEDAFHPCRGDYVALMCLKNPDLVETMACSAPDLDWSRLDVDALAAPVFLQMPDNSHRPDNGTSSTGDPTIDRLRARSFELIEAWNARPEHRPILFGDHHDPYLALDPYHMRTEELPERFADAFAQLCAEIERNMRGIALRPGEILFIDNFRAVHGRKSFQPRYDGSDRWLKRLNITRNFRGSRAWRPAPDCRVIY